MTQTVLFVDDEVLPAKLYLRALQESGFKVIHLKSVDEALHFAETAQDRVSVDLLVLDLMMPPGEALKDEETLDGVTTGLVLRGALRKYYPKQPIVFLTNINNPEILQPLEDEPGTRILHKFSYPPFELVDEMKKVLEAAVSK